MPRIAVAWPQPDYLISLERAGATPRVLDPQVDRVPDVLDACDGILLTGGADVDPSRYGAADRHATLRLDEARDAYEIELFHEFVSQGKPVFGICRGHQLINVALGGSLYQDVATQCGAGSGHHRDETKYDQAFHEMRILPGTWLSRRLPLSKPRRHSRKPAMNMAVRGWSLLAPNCW